MRTIFYVVLFALLLSAVPSLSAADYSCGTSTGKMGFESNSFNGKACYTSGMIVCGPNYMQPTLDCIVCTRTWTHRVCHLNSNGVEQCGDQTDCVEYSKPEVGHCATRSCTSQANCSGAMCSPPNTNMRWQSCVQPTAFVVTCVTDPIIPTYISCVGPFPAGCGSFCQCVNICPIAVSLKGKGFKFTEPTVVFRLNDDPANQGLFSFPDASRSVGWLVADENEDNVIDRFYELVGNGKTIPAEHADKQPIWNGYEWLKTKDANGDGVIDAADPIYAKLGVWTDSNMNGRSDPGEVVTLESQGILGINLAYFEMKQKDQVGNEFRYRSKLILAPGSQAEEWSWDVFPVTKPLAGK